MSKKKKAITITIIAVVAVAVVMSAVYAVSVAYWGRRHAVLYDVKTVTVKQTDKTVFDLTYDVSVKNWVHDRKQHTYKLRANLRGEPGSYDFEGGSDYFITGAEPTAFKIKVRFDISSVSPYYGMPESDEGLIKEVIGLSRFAAFDESGEEDTSAELFMSDNGDAEIIFTE